MLRPTSLAALAVVAIACSGAPAAAPTDSGGDPSPSAAAPTPSLTPSATASSEPTASREPQVVIAATLEFSEDASRAAETTVTFEDGGTVTATGADGTTFQLTIPRYAVADDTAVKMTPLDDVRGVGDATAYAVRLEPDGLQLLQWARLTVTPPTPVPVANQLMFEAGHDGSELRAALIDPKSEDMVLLLSHFSIWGSASVPEAAGLWQVTNSLSRIKRLRHEVGVHLQKQHLRYSQGEDPSADELLSFFEAAEREAAGPMRDGAAISCEGAKLYIETIIRLMRERQYVGLSNKEYEDAVAAEHKRAFDASFAQCERLKIEECQAKQKPEILVAFWLSWEKERILTFGEDEVPLPPDMYERAGKICVRALMFKFEGSGTASDHGYPQTITWRYWGLHCLDDPEWYIWEEFDGINQDSSTGPPTTDNPYGPIRSTFDENGKMVASRWPAFPDGHENLMFHPNLGGTLQGTVDLVLLPGNHPTDVVVTIREGQGNPIRFAEPVVPWDGSFGECPEDAP